MEDFVIKDGELVEYHGTGRKIKIPEGTESFSWQVFYKGFILDDKITEIRIPDSVKRITGGTYCDRVTMYFPKYLESLDRTSLPKHLIIYDSCKIDMTACFSDFLNIGTGGRGRRVIDVLSAETGKVRYSVLWDEGNGTWHGAYREMIRSAWKSLDFFDFDIYDSFFKNLKTAELKTEQAFFRLKNPYDLSEEHKKTYISYLQRNAKKILHELIDKKDSAELEFAAENGILDKLESLEDAIVYAQKKSNLNASVFLIRWKKDHFGDETPLTKSRTIIGAVVEMGSDPKTGEPLKWVIIDQKKKKNFLLCTDILCERSYFCDTKLKREEYKTLVCWEDSLLRKWLNEDFIDQHFTKSEIEQIEPTSHKSKLGTTSDLVFILSDREFLSFVADNATVAKDINKTNEYEYLKDISNGGKCVNVIQLSGRSGDYYRGTSSSSEAVCGVRPAMWVKV